MAHQPEGLTVSRGLGKAQRTMLEAITKEPGWHWVNMLGETLGMSPRHARQVARSLEARGLVATQRSWPGWQGLGESGQVVREWVNEEDGPPAPNARRINEWTEHLPERTSWKGELLPACERREVLYEFRQGMPMPSELCVAPTAWAAEWQAAEDAKWAEIRASFRGL